MKTLTTLLAIAVVIVLLPVAAQSQGRGFDANVNLHVTSLNPPIFSGETNLPDGARLSGALRGTSPGCEPMCYRELPIAVVRGGQFSFSVADEDRLKAGFYEFDVLFMSRGQPSSVQAVTGPKGENLRGPDVAVLSENGRYEAVQFPRPAVVGKNEKMMGLLIRKQQRVNVQNNGKIFAFGTSRPKPEIRNGWYTLHRSDQVAYSYSINLNSVQPSREGGAQAEVVGGPTGENARRQVRFDCQNHLFDQADAEAARFELLPSSIEAQMSAIVCTLASP